MGQNTNNYKAIVFRKRDDPSLYQELGIFRKALFVDRLNWDLSITPDGREEDSFDTSDATYAVLFVDERIIGTFRAIRTDKPYLAMGVFPELASVKAYPKRVDVWEISRFGALPAREYLTTAGVLYALMFKYALTRNIQSLVAVTDLVHERYLAKQHIRTRRFGIPVRFGNASSPARFNLVAGEIPIRDQDKLHLANLMSNLNGVPIDDKTLVLGRSRLQA